MLGSVLMVIFVLAALALGGLALLIGAVAAIKVTVFLVLSIAVASTLVAISPRFQR